MAASKWLIEKYRNRFIKLNIYIPSLVFICSDETALDFQSILKNLST